MTAEGAQVLASWPLDGGLQICLLDRVDAAHSEKVRAHFEGVYPILDWRPYMSTPASARVKELQQSVASRQRLTLGVFDEGEMVGWSFGWQLSMDSTSFYMANSCVVETHRRKGLYQAMLQRVLALSEEMGFQALTSRHLAGNNPILIAKLKAGFHIVGLELSEVHGSLVHLRYFHNPVRREAYQVRTGGERPKHPAVRSLFLEDG